MLDFKLKVGHYDLYFMVQWLYSLHTQYVQGYIVFILSSVCQSFHASVLTVTSVSWSSDFAIYLEDGLMYENDRLG